MSPIVIDNYVSFNSFQTLKKGFMGSEFPWFYNPHVLTAAGEDEDNQGLPFVGRAGQLLNKMLSAINLER